MLGRNGAGKSTTVDCVAGLCAPDQGRIRASFYRHPADIAGLLAMLDLTEKRNTRYRRLSGGQKQRLSIALALIGRPRIAILDELSTGLDPVARRDSWQLIDDIRNTGVTIMLITHLMTEAERLCDRVAIMHDGQVRGRGRALLPLGVTA